MEYQTKIKWSFISAIVASVCWVIGDIAIAGFEITPQKYPLFSETYADEIDVEFAVLMLEGSTQRLMFGALIAAMTAILFLPGVWLAYQYVKDHSKWYAWGTYFILVLSVLLMPLGHAVFFYTGEIFKSIYNSPVAAHPYLLETAAGFMQMLYITWGTAIFVLLLGWFLFSVLIFLEKTTLPRWVGLISPVFLTIYQVPVKSILPASTFKDWLTAAGFNLSYLIFFLLLLIFFRKKLFKPQTSH